MILTLGSIAMAICAAAVGAGIHFEYYLTAYVFMLVFIVCFNVSQGNVAFIYCAEVTVDQASGIVMFSFFMSLCLFSVTAEYMMNSFLEVSGTFWVYAGLNFLGFLFCLIWVKETMGLTDAEKKLLYAPVESEDESTKKGDEKVEEEDVAPNNIN